MLVELTGNIYFICLVFSLVLTVLSRHLFHFPRRQKTHWKQHSVPEITAADSYLGIQHKDSYGVARSLFSSLILLACVGLFSPSVFMNINFSGDSSINKTYFSTVQRFVLYIVKERNWIMGARGRHRVVKLTR